MTNWLFPKRGGVESGTTIDNLVSLRAVFIVLCHPKNNKVRL